MDEPRGDRRVAGPPPLFPPFQPARPPSPVSCASRGVFVPRGADPHTQSRDRRAGASTDSAAGRGQGQDRAKGDDDRLQNGHKSRGRLQVRAHKIWGGCVRQKNGF